MPRREKTDGTTVDLCRECWDKGWDEVEHPPYGDDPTFPRFCKDCGKQLTKEDN